MALPILCWPMLNPVWNAPIAYGDIDEAFYLSMERMYESVWKFIVQKDLTNDFLDRLKAIVGDTRNIGWGFHDQLHCLYEDYQEKLGLT